MARPAKPASLHSSSTQTKAEMEARQKNEDKIKGDNNKIKPAKYLSKEQKAIFKYVVSELKEANILGNLDVYMLNEFAIAVDRLMYIETELNDTPAMLATDSGKQLMSAKDKYSKIFFRCCNELGLSPQSRAKIANIAVQAKNEQEDPVVKALSILDAAGDENC